MSAADHRTTAPDSSRLAGTGNSGPARRASSVAPASAPADHALADRTSGSFGNAVGPRTRAIGIPVSRGMDTPVPLSCPAARLPGPVGNP